jgi:hypothetical protein
MKQIFSFTYVGVRDLDSWCKRLNENHNGAVIEVVKSDTGKGTGIKNFFEM